MKSIATHRCIAGFVRAAAILLALLSFAPTAAAQDSNEKNNTDNAAAAPLRDEVRVIRQSMASRHWLVRAVAAMQLEGQSFPEAGTLLRELAEDRDWRVRAFTIRSIGRRQDAASIITQPIDDREPRVLRIALMHGLPVDASLLTRLTTTLLRSRATEDRLIGIELAALGDDPSEHTHSRNSRTRSSGCRIPNCCT